jgi:hypothetical protein
MINGKLPGSPHTKADIRIQQVARYRIAGRLKDTEIAEIVGMTPAGLKYLLTTPAYVELEESLLSGRISQMDMQLAEDLERMKGSFRVAIPVAARTLLEVVQQRRDLRSALAAASEILDRDPQHTFSKQSRNSSLNNGDGNGPGQEFNPQAFGTNSTDPGMMATMTADAARVTIQIQASNNNPQKPPSGGSGGIVVVPNSEQTSLHQPPVKNCTCASGVWAGTVCQICGGVGMTPPQAEQLLLFNIEKGLF